MRLDKFFSSAGILSRSDCAKKIREGRVSVNGTVAKKGDLKVDPEKDVVTLDGEVVKYMKFVYILLNKPEGVVCATEDERDATVLDLLPPEIRSRKPFPCGRLDKDTLGLVIVTDDGVSAHNALSPKRHVVKKYLYRCADPLGDEDARRIESGITLGDGYTAKPCTVERTTYTEGYIYLTEGKYHEIKRMFGAVGNKITYLERVSFGSVSLGDLPRGQWRYMTGEEIAAFTSAEK